jgi:hypothetical protein
MDDVCQRPRARIEEMLNLHLHLLDLHADRYLRESGCAYAFLYTGKVSSYFRKNSNDQLDFDDVFAVYHSKCFSFSAK